MQRIGTQITLILRKDQIAELDRIAGKLGMKRAEVVRDLLDVGMDTFKVYEKIGVIRLADYAKRTRKAIEQDVQPSLI